MKLPKFLTLLVLFLILPMKAHAFCGLFVSKAGDSLYNETSKIVFARADNRSVITMVNDFKGEAKDFAMVVPVPTVLKRNQINVADSKLVQHLVDYSAPRLAKYVDPNPCPQSQLFKSLQGDSELSDPLEQWRNRRSTGASFIPVPVQVQVLEEYTVGEYDIKILSAQESGDLITWLNREGYKTPENAKRTLASYIKQDMKFFVAKINLDKFERGEFQTLNALQIAFESEKFMLPIRLGTVNSAGMQDMIVTMLTNKGRVETSNYRTVKMPTDTIIPFTTHKVFENFYEAAFKRQHEKHDGKAVFMEYMWDIGNQKCDPCAANHIPDQTLIALGAWWLNGNVPFDRSTIEKRNEEIKEANRKTNEEMMERIKKECSSDDRNGFMQCFQNILKQSSTQPLLKDASKQRNTYLTRLHARYSAETFPEDLVFHETADKEHYQVRYVIHQEFRGDTSCPAGQDYLKDLAKRNEEALANMKDIAGWKNADLTRAIENIPVPKKPDWYEIMWNKK